MQTKPMTAEELRIEIARLCGYVWRDQGHFYYLSCRSNAQLARDKGIPESEVKEEIPPAGAVIEKTLRVPHYCTDISAAWPLIQLVLDYNFDPEFDRRLRWREYWSQPEVPRLECIFDQSEAARHISLAAYYALTGTRVEIVESEGEADVTP